MIRGNFFKSRVVLVSERLRARVKRMEEPESCSDYYLYVDCTDDYHCNDEQSPPVAGAHIL